MGFGFWGWLVWVVGWLGGWFAGVEEEGGGRYSAPLRCYWNSRQREGEESKGNIGRSRRTYAPHTDSSSSPGRTEENKRSRKKKNSQFPFPNQGPRPHHLALPITHHQRIISLPHLTPFLVLPVPGFFRHVPHGGQHAQDVEKAGGVVGAAEGSDGVL